MKKLPVAKSLTWLVLLMALILAGLAGCKSDSHNDSELPRSSADHGGGLFLDDTRMK